MNDQKLAAVPLVFGSGGLALLLKGVFFLRKTSAGLTSSQPALSLKAAAVPKPIAAPVNSFPKMPTLLSQLIQDFGTGPFIAGPVIHKIAADNHHPWSGAEIIVFIAGAALFGIGWMGQRLAKSA